MKLNEKMKNFIGMTIFAIFVLGIFIGIYFLGILGFSQLLGIKYDSLWALAIFVISVFVLGIFIEVVFDALTVLAVEKVSSHLITFIIQLLFGFVSEWIALAVVDVAMISVTLSEKTILIIAFSLALLGTFIDNKKQKLEKTTE